MRLKTKILLLCCISVLFSSAVCSVAVYVLVKNFSLDAAEGQSFKDAIAAFSALEDDMTALKIDKDDAVDEKVLQYICKKQGDKLLVCFASGIGKETEIFNSTVFNKENLEELHYNSNDELGVQRASMNWEGKTFFVYRQEMYNGVIYKLEDITYVWERMRLLGIGLVSLMGAVTVVVCFVLFILLKKVLQPLHELSAGAKQIAKGRYDKRIVVKRRDEIGELSDNFNQMAEAVQFRTDSLEEAERRRTLFMGNLTHELKTPMTAISGYAQTLLTVKLPEEDREEALSYIYEESCRLERLSRKLMNLLLLEEEDAINPVEVTAKELFYKAEEACRQNLLEDGIRLECHEEGESFRVDEDLFTEVLINLIDNARKASSAGDRIILSAKGNEIEVRDFGRGIPEEEKDKILEPFYMIDKSRSRKSGGAGLGLAITALILKRHNCRMHIESKVGEGTRMKLQFV